MSDDPQRTNESDPVAAGDDAAAAMEEAEVERNDTTVEAEAADDTMTIPGSAPVDQPAPVLVDGVS